jgi:hypothetical protein
MIVSSGSNENCVPIPHGVSVTMRSNASGTHFERLAHCEQTHAQSVVLLTAMRMASALRAPVHGSQQNTPINRPA